MPRLTSVLLVDDDSTANYLSGLLLKRADVTDNLLVAENGEQALRLLATVCQPPDQAQCPALILLDVNMPVLNGIEFLEAYQHLPVAQRQGIVVMLLTSASVERDINLLHGLPIDGMLEKPLTKVKLQLLLDTHFPLV